MSKGFCGSFYYNNELLKYNLVDLLGRPLNYGNYFIAVFNYSFYSEKTFSFTNILPVFKIEQDGRITAISVDGEVIEDYRVRLLGCMKDCYDYVYKIKLTNDVKSIMQGNKARFNDYEDLKSLELLQREVKAGDLVLCNCDDNYGFSKYTNITFFGIVTGHNKIFTGDAEIKGVYKYLISNPEGKEVSIKRELTFKYKQYMINKIISNKGKMKSKKSVA